MNSVANASRVVELRNVSKFYSKGGVEVRAVDNISLEVARGERVAVLGKSGSGKSTLLNLIGGLDYPTEGDIAVAGRKLSGLSSNQMAAYRRDSVGMVFQAYNLVASRTALQNVELPAIFVGRGLAERRAIARQMLTAVGLENRLNHRPAELSGGEQQRVAIARAMMNQPDLLLADEPTGNLDTKTAAEIIELLDSAVAERGATMVVVTHDEQLAKQLAMRIVHMVDGRIDDDLERNEL